MGTKNDPGDFDCYEAADPDEPIFILRAKDPLAPSVVRHWAELRRLTRDDRLSSRELDKRAEAKACAEAMEAWRRDHP